MNLTDLFEMILKFCNLLIYVIFDLPEDLLVVEEIVESDHIHYE